MADSKRQIILNAIDTALKTIKIANGYETDLGNNIFEWREEPLQESELPAAIWRDTDEPVEFTIGAHEHKLTVEIELYAVGPTSPTILRKLIADVVKLVGANLTWSGNAEDTKPQTEDIKTEKESRRIAGALVKFEVIYTTNRFDPYN